MVTRILTEDEKTILDTAEKMYCDKAAQANVAYDMRALNTAWADYQRTLKQAGIVATLAGYRAEAC
jgi:hypothetical protein